MLAPAKVLSRSETKISRFAMFLWEGRFRLVKRRTLWCPTLLGFFCLLFLAIIPLAWWFSFGESFLSSTTRVPAEILVVEGWIGRPGVRAAAAEFEQRGYR
jgi:hypothetical protein